MREKNKSFINKQVGILVLACLLCISGLIGCRKNDLPEPDTNITQSVTEVPTVKPTDTPTPTPTPTPEPEPWESYEKIDERNVYRVPADKLTNEYNVTGGSCSGEYVLLQLWERDPEEDGHIWEHLLLLRPALSGDAVFYSPDYYPGYCKVLADGTVFLEESENSTVHVLDASFNEIKTIASEDGSSGTVISVTDDGHIWRSCNETKELSVCDRNGENTVIVDIGEGRSAQRDLGEKDGKRYFIAANSADYTSDVILCVDELSGEVSEVSERIINVTIGNVPDYYVTAGNIIYDISNETWFLHLIAGNGHRIAFPRRYQYENIDCTNGSLLCVSGYIWGTDGSEYSWVKPGGCSIYDIEKRVKVGEITTLELEPYNRMSVIGIQDSGLVIMTGGFTDDSDNEHVDLLLWNLNAENAEPIKGFFDLTEEDPEDCLERLANEYRENYGIVYTPSEMKTIEYDAEFDTLQRMDFLNRLARGIVSNPEEFPKDADGITLRLENVRGHERGHSEFNPHIFSDLTRDYYGEDYEQAFYRMIDALRAGEDTFEAEYRIMYNWSVALFATWYYPITTQCISTSYSYYDEDEWKNGKGRIKYIVPKEDAAVMMSEFEQLICDTIDDCISDDYTDFEKALALYEYITENWSYDYDMYEHINEIEWTSKGSIYRCLTEHLGICWEIAGVYEYLLMQCGINAEDAEGFNADLSELHAWTYLMLDGQGYNVDPTWGLSYGRAPELKYFCFTDKEREERDFFPFENCFTVWTDTMNRAEHEILADDERYSPLWNSYYIGMDRTTKTVIYEDIEGVLHSFRYED